MFSRRKQPKNADLDREIGFHLDQLTEEYMARGVSPHEARRQALLAFGGPTQIKQSLREVYLWAALDRLKFSARAAFRFLLQAPGFSLAVITTLALGMPWRLEVDFFCCKLRDPASV